ncbi:hypothetical protein [Streptomyces sp. WAC04114]|uniref:hypothetical protein n=1 Tax=Streptomyces sp. WAC04114 TaxID=2867961 RepID=UPI001C8BDAB9|nr:hypothetical protein [Streptomyces sp. WAC04114]MBX9363941.1 hypothetical protein [Streptomyces sp. WAC04114]
MQNSTGDELMSGTSVVGSQAGGRRVFPEFSEDYFVSLHGRIEFLPFEDRVASLAWLRDRIAQSIDSELAEPCATRRSGAHRVPGWGGESDLILDESLMVLDGDTRQIGAGIIVVTVAAALESLMNHMLDQSSDTRLHRAGLAKKADPVAGGDRYSNVPRRYCVAEDTTQLVRAPSARRRLRQPKLHARRDL